MAVFRKRRLYKSTHDSDYPHNYLVNGAPANHNLFKLSKQVSELFPDENLKKDDKEKYPWLEKVCEELRNWKESCEFGTQYVAPWRCYCNKSV
jgi:hypothetical protein